MNILIVTDVKLSAGMTMVLDTLNRLSRDKAIFQDSYIGGATALTETMGPEFDKFELVITAYGERTLGADVGLMGESVKKAKIPWMVVTDEKLEADEVKMLTAKGATDFFMHEFHRENDILEMVGRARKE